MMVMIKGLKDFGKYNMVVNFIATLLANIGVGALIGYYLDKWTFNNRVLLVVFLLLGIFSGFYNGFRMLLKEVERYDRMDKTNKGSNKNDSDIGDR